MLPKKTVVEFKRLYKEKYGEELTDFVASEVANRFVRFVELIYKPIPKEWEEKYKEIKKEQDAVPEDKKIDFVRHLVSDAKLTEWKMKNHPPKRGKRFKQAKTI